MPTSTAIHDDIIARLQCEFEIPRSSLSTILDSFLGEFDKGLQSHGQAVPMIPTYVYHLPTGHETGIYLAIDLGGTNLRVCRVDLLGNRKFAMRQQKYLISNDLKHAHTTDLFDYIAKCLKTFIDTECIDSHPHGQGGWKIGFTFSFPVEQLHINHGKLLRWTKGFNCSEAVGQNMAQLLQDALDRIKANATVVAITNDTTGTLVATNYTDSDAHMGLILGTGTNAAYVEKLDAMPKCLAEEEANTVKRRLRDEGAEAQMVVNTEWGAFGGNNPNFPRTKYDLALDAESVHPGTQPFEKMISGMYLGEISRLVLVDLIDQGVLFGDAEGDENERRRRRQAWDVKYESWLTAYMSAVESDTTPNLTDTEELLNTHFNQPSTLRERQIVQRVCQFVGYRAATLSALGIAAIVRKRSLIDGDKICHVGVDGSVVNKYPYFKERIHETLCNVFGEENAKRIKIVHAEDGSGLGAALVAMLASQDLHLE